MFFVKLIAKQGTWFKAGTEVFVSRCPLSKGGFCRMTLGEYLEAVKDESPIVGCGIRVTEDKSELAEIGEARWDEECCPLDEFDWTVVVNNMIIKDGWKYLRNAIY